MQQRSFNVDNWGRAPYNRQSFQYVQQLFPTARLLRNDQLQENRELQQQDLNGVTFTNISGEKSSIGALLEDSFTDAFLVAKDGVLLTEHYENGMHQDQHHLINSVTKTFVGMLAGIAVEQGVLNPENAVESYLPELSTSAWRGTTVRQVLDMTAGAQYWEDYDDPKTEFWQEAAVAGWRPALVNSTTPPTLRDYAASLREKIFTDGEKFHYKTVMTNVLGMVLEEVMGQPLVQLLQEHIWGRLPMRNDGALVVDKSGFPYVGAGLNACARDLLTFGELLISRGRCNGEQIIPESWIEDTLKGDDQSKPQFLEGEYGEVLTGWHYRNQTWLTDKDTEMLAIGIHGQMIYMNVETQVVIVKLSTFPMSADHQRVLDTILASQAISEYLTKA